MILKESKIYNNLAKKVYIETFGCTSLQDLQYI